MNENMFTNYLSSYQSMSRAFTDVMLNQWRWLFTPCQFGIGMMDDFMVGSRRSVAASYTRQATAPEANMEEAPLPEKESPPETLEQVAMKRLNSGYAPPREIYDVRNRDQIDWSKVPDWAKPVDPELFEGAHEG